MASNVEAVAVVNLGPDTTPPPVPPPIDSGGTVSALLVIPFLLASIPCETSLLQDELSLTSFFVPEAAAEDATVCLSTAAMVAAAVDLDGGC